MFDIKGFKQVATYCELTGNFYWNKSHSRAGLNCSSVHTGTGTHLNHNFKAIVFKKKYILTHRVVWFFHKGVLREDERILFKNLNAFDTRIENLYSVSIIRNDVREHIRYISLKNGEKRFGVYKYKHPRRTFKTLEEAITYRDSLCTR
jgi:hypothetical protein